MLFTPRDSDTIPWRLGIKVEKNEPKPDVLEKILEGIDWIEWALVGSTFVNGSGKDIDLLVLKPNWRQQIPTKWARSDDGDYSNDHEFYSYRYSKYNLLVVTNKINFDKFLLASRVSKALNLSDKKMRVALHEAIRHNKFDDLLWDILPKGPSRLRKEEKQELQVSCFDDDIPF